MLHSAVIPIRMVENGFLDSDSQFFDDEFNNTQNVSEIMIIELESSINTEYIFYIFSF